MNTKNDNVKDNDSDKCSKLTKVVSNKSKEIAELKAENKLMKERSQEVQKKMNEMSSSVSTLAIKNTRLESQVENLINAFGNKSGSANNATNSAKNDDEETTPKHASKCKHNDKAICTRKETCQFSHSKAVCSSYSKFGVCEREESCTKRHPHGTCNRWKRGSCDKGFECFYRHPIDEEGSESRKRTLSEQMLQSNKTLKTAENQKTNEEHFLFKRMMEKLLEEKKPVEKETPPTGWMNPYNQQPANPHPTMHQQPNHAPSYQPPFTPACSSGGQYVRLVSAEDKPNKM